MSERGARICRRCWVAQTVTPSGHLRSHRCSHGKPCVLPYAERKQGKKPRVCRRCMAARQLELFTVAEESCP